MAELMNTNMEKHYFIYILDNPDQFSKVDPFFFKNSDIQFIYTVIREEYLKSESHIVPSTQQIYSMVKLVDQENKINDKVIRMLLESDNSDISQEWLLPRFKGWKVQNQLKGDMLKGIDMIRGIEEVNYDNIVEVAQNLKSMFGNVLLVDDDDQDLGADFDDPESHKQLLSKNNIPSGWSCVDTILGGGWSKSTLNVIMGETNVGKCFSANTYISIKSKITGEIMKIKTIDFYNSLKK